MVANEVGNGEIQPDVTLTLNAFVNPFHRFLVNGMHYRVTRPHNFYRLIHIATERTEITALFIGPTAIVFCRTHHERTNVALCFHKVGVDIVQEFSLLISLCAFSPNIVEENGKRTHTKLIHGFEFLHHGVAIGFCPLNIYTGVDCPVEVYTVLVRSVEKNLKACCFFGGIRLTPLITVIRVILRTVNVNVHLVLSIEIELRESVFLTPGCAIETFNYATESNVREVGDFTSLQLAVLHHCEQRLYAIKSTAFVLRSNNNFLVSHLKVITFCLCGYEFFILLNCLLITPTERHLKGCLGSNSGRCCFECIKSVRRSNCLVSNNSPLCGHVNHKVCHVRNLLWHGVNVAYLSLTYSGAKAKEGSKDEFFVHNY